MNRTETLITPQQVWHSSPFRNVVLGLRRLANMLNGSSDADGASIGISSQDYLAMIKPTAQ